MFDVLENTPQVRSGLGGFSDVACICIGNRAVNTKISKRDRAGGWELVKIRGHFEFIDEDKERSCILGNSLSFAAQNKNT